MTLLITAIMMMSSIDAVMTGILLSNHGLEFEANPIMLMIYSNAGLIGGGIIKLFITLIGISIIYYTSTFPCYYSSSKKALLFLSLFYCMIMVFHIIPYMVGG